MSPRNAEQYARAVDLWADDHLLTCPHCQHTQDCDHVFCDQCASRLLPSPAELRFFAEAPGAALLRRNRETERG